MDSRRKYQIAILVLLAVIAGGGGYLAYTHFSAEPDMGGSAYVDPDASPWEDGLDRPEKIEGKILIPGYSGAQMAAGERELRLSIGNPEENTCYLKATLMLEDGTVLYESGFIEPGKGFEKVKLERTLDAGVYNALVHYQGYTMDDEPEELNSSDSAFTLTVYEKAEEEKNEEK